MKIIDDIILLLTTACQAGSACVFSVVIKTVKQICLAVSLAIIALALMLGALGLMIAALFIGLAPHLGAHWAAMIAAGASLVGSAIFLAVAGKVFKGTGGGG
jgi:hypothetical protein